MIQIGAPDNLAKANALLDPRPRAEPFDPGLGQAAHREGAQRRRHPLSRAFRRSWIRLRPKPRAARSNAPDFPASPPTTDAYAFGVS